MPSPKFYYLYEFIYMYVKIPKTGQYAHHQCMYIKSPEKDEGTSL